MEINSHHDLAELFAQLGLPNDSISIQHFIDQHRPLSENLQIWQAPFWTVSQMAFLKQGWMEDADWENTIEQLNTLLRESR